MQRQPLYIGDGDDACFGWLHVDEAASPRDCCAVLCAPTGHEYTRAHRTLRHLADRLARDGVPALRFDYPGVGDSPGTDLDPARVDRWLENIRAAVAAAREATGRTRVCLVGVRLGASLAAMSTWDAPADLLVLWNPVLRGRTYVRELQAIAMTAERVAHEVDGALESAGFVMSRETIEAVKHIDLLGREIKAARVLVVARDDVAADMALNEKLGAAGIENAYYRAPGWAGMMAEHQFTVVPDEALQHIVEWVGCHSDSGRPREGGDPAGSPEGAPPSVAFDFDRSRITESACLFGEQRHLFGVLAQGRGGKDRPAIVMCNAGSVHHVGPNRIYVTLARHLASAGYDSLRFDLESLGDSVLRAPGRENYPYPHTATADARAAIELLKSQGYRRFIVLGLCSGAHTTFHTGLELHDDPIEELILINPMSFYWKEGNSLDTSRRYEDAAAYKRSARDPSRWLKLLRGEVNMKRLLEVIIADARDKMRFREDPRLAGDLKKLQGLNRAVTLFIAEGDPGRDILMAGAPRTARRALKHGNMRVEMIPDADHTFSQFKPRSDLFGRLNAHLARRAGAPPPAPGPDA